MRTVEVTLTQGDKYFLFCAIDLSNKEIEEKNATFGTAMTSVFSIFLSRQLQK